MAKKPKSNRVVLVVDRGWIFAGDLSGPTKEGYYRMERAVWVFRWERIGFAAMVAAPKTQGVDIRACEPVEVPAASIVFRVPVSASWGL